MRCSSLFTVTNRRHHCRFCGFVVCGVCSTHDALLPDLGYAKPVRVCDCCFEYVKDARSSNIGIADGYASLDVLLVQSIIIITVCTCLVQMYTQMCVWMCLCVCVCMCVCVCVCVCVSRAAPSALLISLSWARVPSCDKLNLGVARIAFHLRLVVLLPTSSRCPPHPMKGMETTKRKKCVRRHWTTKMDQ